MATKPEQAVANIQAKYKDKVVRVDRETFQYYGLGNTPHTKGKSDAVIKILGPDGKPVTFSFPRKAPAEHPFDLPSQIPRASLRLWPEVKRKHDHWKSLGMQQLREPLFCVNYANSFESPGKVLQQIAGCQRNALAYLVCAYGQVAAVPCKCCQRLMNLGEVNLPLAECVKMDGEMGGKCGPCFVNGHDCDAFVDLDFGPPRIVSQMEDDDTVFRAAGVKMHQ